MMKRCTRDIYFLLNFVGLQVALNAAQLQTRITGGSDALDGEFPYHAIFSFNTHVQCGGALISRQHVLTSAHCFLPILEVNTSLYMAVVLGSIRLLQGQSYAIKRLSYYKEYTKNLDMPFFHDIGLIHLAVPVVLSPNIAPIGLPTFNVKLPVGLPTILTGFGSHYFNGPKASILRKLAVRTVSYEKCQEAHNSSAFLSPVICATFGPGFGSCSGDSGGPLVNMNRNTLLGILSGGTIDCGNGDADIYTEVSQYISYILEEMNYNLSDSNTSSSHPGMNFHSYYPSPLPSQGPLLHLPPHFHHIIS